jgi:WS/DGAT/MGAT family acyltransferase
MAHYNYTRLSIQDNDFLRWESPSLPMHTSGVQLFASGDLATEEGGIDFDRIKRATEAVLHRVPRYRQKLMWIPGTDRAIWVDDPKFSIDYHLRHISLPRPGTDAQLKHLASRIMEYPLDRSRPLWETWVVEGLQGHRFAMVAKTHHCMIDGSSGMDLANLMMSREPRDRIDEPPRYIPRPMPSPRALAREERTRRLQGPARMAGRLRAFASEVDDWASELGDRARAVAEMAGYKIRPASQTPLNGEIGPHRIFEYADFSFEDLRAVRRELDASINDLVLTIVTGALRRFLTRRSVRLDGIDFRVSTPVNVRTEKDEGRVGNRVSSWIVPLPLDEPDPLEALARIHQTTQRLKDENAAVAVEMMNALQEWFPIDIQSASAGTQNMIVTNVPGPPFPLYLLGAELLGIYPQAPLIANLGLVIGVVTYNGRMCWGFNADLDRVPDLADFRADIACSLERLAEAAGVRLTPPAPQSLAAG